MQDARGNGRAAQAKPILNQTTTYPLEISDESESPEAEHPSAKRAAELVRSYNEGNRDFSMANLYRAKLHGANLQNAQLLMADLRQAKLYGANLQGAKLRGANLQEADLREADLRGADLQEANLIGAKLAGAKLDDATRISATWRLICETINDDNNGHKSNGKSHSAI